MTAEGTFPKVDGDVLYDGDINVMPPIGTIVAWHKSLTGTPTLPNNWVECSGQTISDAESVYDGQTLPNLNGNSARIIGDSTTSGTYTSSNNISVDNQARCCSNPNDGIKEVKVNIPTYTMIWIIKIK
jgi:hypothetical protein